MNESLVLRNRLSVLQQRGQMLLYRLADAPSRFFNGFPIAQHPGRVGLYAKYP
jgi:hypothetical protein